jgi:hypothetical protein
MWGAVPEFMDVFQPTRTCALYAQLGWSDPTNYDATFEMEDI